MIVHDGSVGRLSHKTDAVNGLGEYLSLSSSNVVRCAAGGSGNDDNIRGPILSLGLLLGLVASGSLFFLLAAGDQRKNHNHRE